MHDFMETIYSREKTMEDEKTNNDPNDAENTSESSENMASGMVQVQCLATDCRFNIRGSGKCNLRRLILYPNGICSDYEKLTMERVEKLLSESGFNEEGLKIIRDALGK